MAAGSILGLLAWFSSAGAEAEEQAKADVVLRNGKIYTADKERSIKQTIAFRGNTIVAVGSDADVAPLIGSGTNVIDLGGKLVLPGFIDTHIHPIIGALNGAKCSLAGVKATIEALKPVIQGLPGQRSRQRRRVVRGGAARQLRLLGDGKGPRYHRGDEAGRALGQ